MRREGRQHGMVRTYPILPVPWDLRPKSRTLNELVPPPTAGIFAKTSTKPTNHSKFTGKCGRPMCRQCHILPASKSKNKVKGVQKIRFSSAQKVVDAEPDLKFSGFSVSSVLNFLSNDNDYEDNYIDDNDILEIGECDTE
ncbi:hypothetical protein CDL12_20416 [Handroanthus impetiginosus]|uniref:Uncharacterized protein n=1 Tax=Handroanthus impetiginosus TaxID=429701 RepID=A0A2G9GP25_9LAMI|nr:hypothetical protein CDL12_20416 [Handroanthus impetiginosus]